MYKTLRQNSGVSAIALAFIVYYFLLMMLYGDSQKLLIANNMGQLLGFLVLPIIITKFTFRNKSDSAKNKALLIIGICANLLVLGIVYSEWSAAKKLSETIDKYSIVDGKIIGNVEGNVEELNKIDKDPKLPAYSPSQYGKLDGLLKYNFAVSKPFYVRFEKNSDDIQNLGLEKVLTPKLFIDKNEIKKAQEIIDKARALAKEQIVIADEMFLAQKNAFENVDVDKNIKNEFFKGVIKGHEKSKAMLILQNNASNGILDGHQTILNLAIKNLGKVKTDNNIIDFGNEADNQTYNNAVDKITSSATEEERLLKLREKQQQDNIERMKTLVAK